MSDNPDPNEPNTSADEEFDFEEESSSQGVRDEQERRLEEMEQRLERKESELDEREQRLEREASELNEREDDLLGRREEVVGLREEVEALESDIEDRKQRLDEREVSIDEQERELEERSAELARKEQTLQNYVDDQLAGLENELTETVRTAVDSSMQNVEGGDVDEERLTRTVRRAVDSSMQNVEGGGVDDETLSRTVRESVDSAIDGRDLGANGSAFGAVLGSLLAFLGILLVAGGVSNALLTFLGEGGLTILSANSTNYIASSGLVIIGFAANLAAAAGRV